MRKNSTLVKILSVALTALLLIGMVPTQAFAQGIDDPLSGSTGSGWEDYGGMDYDTGADFKDDNYAPFEDDQEDEVFSADELQPVDDNQEVPSGEEVPLGLSGDEPLTNFPWAQNFSEYADNLNAMPKNRSMLRAVQGFPDSIAAGNISTKDIEWNYSGQQDAIKWDGPSGNPFFVGSGRLHVISAGTGDRIAICAEFNGNSAGGAYVKGSPGSNNKIKQYIANYEASSKGAYETGTLQVLVWSELVKEQFGVNLQTWGTYPKVDSIINGTADYSGVTYYTYIADPVTGDTQNIFLYETAEPVTGDFQIKIIKKDAADGKTLAGAGFTVKDSSGKAIGGTHTTGSDGTVTVGVPKPDKYTVTEVTPPSGYMPASNPSQTKEITEANKIPGGKPLEFEYENQKGGEPGEDGDAWGQVTIIKKDDQDNPLKNAIFNIDIAFSDGSKGGNSRFQVVDGANTYTYTHPKGDIGKAKVTVTEVEAPEGYVVDPTPQTIHISPTYHIYEEDEDGNIIKDEWKQGDYGPAIELTFKNHPEEAELIIYKYRKGNSSVALAGAQFEIRAIDTGVNWSTTVTTDSNGYAKISLPRSGTYEIHETKAPEGYIIDVDNDGNSKLHVEVAKGESKQIDIPNTPKGGLTVIKRDAQNTNVHLQGATFRITHIDSGETKEGVTGADGTYTFHDLVPGAYRVEEINPPQYYELDEDNIRTVEIFDDTHETIEIYFDNEPWTGLRILKLDSKSAARLEGAVFGLYEGAEMNADGLPAGHLIGEYVSNANGEVVIQKLKPGAYAIVEHQAPDGYTLDENRVRVIRIDPDDPDRELQVVFRNDPLPDLKIIKRDKETGELLPGATFTLRHEDGAEYTDVTTGPDGTVTIEKLPLGWYKIVEIRQPSGYLMPTEEIPPVELVVGKRTEVVVYNQKMPGLEIVKKDKVTGELLPGATFRISWNNGADFRDVETGDNGKALVEGLADGWYTITELKAPEGYLLNTEPHQVLLEGGTVTTIEIFNEAKPSLEILKVDSKTKTPLQYAEFKIEKKTDEGIKLIGHYITDEDGIIYLEDIQPGRYLITEESAPDGYNIDNRTHEVTIEFGQKYEIEFTNSPKQPIYIAKVDQDGNPLAGAEFVVKTINGAMVGRVKTGRTGYGIIPYAEPGWYTVEEVRAPDGYILNNTPVNVEVKMNMPAELEFVNEKAPGLEILKLDAETRKALIGARFKITKSNGEIVGEYETDSRGLIILEDLEPGTFIISEIRSPDGYILDVTPQTVELKAGETKRVEFFNVAKPGLQLIKKDEITGLPVGGARFNIVELQGSAKKDHGSFTTGENGMFYVPDLAPGHYIITETKAADGYILDPTPRQVYIEGGKLNSVEFFNTPYSDLRLLKIDSESRDPLPGAVFKLFDDKRIEVGTYTTSELGEIYLSGLPSGEYYLQEVKAPEGFVLDNTVRKIELHGGKTTTVEWKNTELGTLRIVKVDAKTGKPLYGATFLLYDSKDNLLGEFHTEQDGTITFGRNLQAGKYKVKEIKAPSGYVLNDTIHTVRIKPGTTTEIKIENEAERGKIQISKVSSAPNEITKDKEGATLQGVVFEIYNNQMELVDTITTDKNGIATSDPLPLGVYGVKETTPADYYVAQDEMFYAHIKVHDDLVKFTVKNDPVHLKTSVEKRGNAEVQAGDSMYYTLSKIRNLSSVPLEEFYIHDVLPTDAVRLEKIWTGTWSERSKLEVQIKTSAKPSYRTVKTGLLSDNNNEIDCSPSALGLASGEYVTEFRIVFREPVSTGFHNTADLKVQVKVLETLSTKGERLCYQFINKVDVGGRYLKEWTYTTDGWTTTVWCRKRGKLPRTGL